MRDVLIVRSHRFGAWTVAAALALAAATAPALAQQGNGNGKGAGPRTLPPPATDFDFRDSSAEKVELGKLLFFDKILSGNRNVSCASCHHPMAHTADGLSLPLGAAATGLSVTRVPGDLATGVKERVPRNAPAIFNLGALEFTTMFHDGRITEDASQPSGFVSPAGDDLPSGLDSALAAQAMFPVTSATEMAGLPGQNGIADAAGVGNLAGPGGVWEQLTERLRNETAYVARFIEAFEDVDEAADLTFVHAANAIAAFEQSAWRADDSPFDRYLRGDKQAMSRDAREGMKLFYGKAQCSSCHAGTFQTDHGFHSIAMPQIGPGKGDGPDGRDDFGRMRETGDPDDLYRFRTPSLRNVTLTGPYSHAGAYGDLEDVVWHHLDPSGALERYDPGMAVLPSRDDLDALDFVVMDDPARRAALAATSEMPVVVLSDDEVRLVIEFLHALTDPSSADLRRDVPLGVPSGEPIAD